MLWYIVHSVVYTCDLILARIWLLDLCPFINRVLQGCTISVPSLCRWVTQTLCTYGRRTKDHREMPCSTIWRSLWCISHSSENLAERFLLAIYVWRYKELHPQMSKLPEAWRDHSSRFNAPELQSSGLTFWCLGYWLHGTFCKIPRMRVYSGRRRLRLQMGRSHAMQSRRCKACP